MSAIDSICRGIDVINNGLGNAIDFLDKRNERQIVRYLEDESFPYKLWLQEGSEDDSFAYIVCDKQGNAVFTAVSELSGVFSAALNMGIFDLSGKRLGHLHHKSIVLPSLLERRQGTNFEFEVEQFGRTFGTLQNKKLGKRFDSPRKVIRDAREGLKGLRFEYDTIDWEILRQNYSYEIHGHDKKPFANAKRVQWQGRNHYVIGYSSKEDEMSCLLSILAMALVDRYFDSLPRSNDGFIDDSDDNF